MIKSEVKNVSLKDDLYQTYYLKLDNGISCYYYEANNNSYVNEIDIIMEGFKIKKIDSNKIYLFLKKNDDIGFLKYVFDYFNNEYSNLKFNYIGFNNSYINGINSISKGLNYEIKSDDKVVERSNNVGNNNYKDYDMNDNELIKKDEDEIDKEIVKDSANYNGYNERLIGKNVKNIVNYKFDNNK